MNVNKNTKEALVKFVRAIYASEPCRICGKLMGDTLGAVWAGYSKDLKSRCAHGSCWSSNIPKEKWAYPEDYK